MLANDAFASSSGSSKPLRSRLKLLNRPPCRDSRPKPDTARRPQGNRTSRIAVGLIQTRIQDIRLCWGEAVHPDGYTSPGRCQRLQTPAGRGVGRFAWLGSAQRNQPRRRNPDDDSPRDRRDLLLRDTTAHVRHCAHKNRQGDEITAIADTFAAGVAKPPSSGPLT